VTPIKRSVDRAAALGFKMAVAHKPCAVCGHRSPMGNDAHHVVEAQYLRRNHPGRVWDQRNAMPLCRRHHELHSCAHERVPWSCLSEANWEFVDEALGEYGRDYVRRYYR
jgi:predicted restriction endonuclease